MNFVVIEGLDGSGKSTQIKMLRDYLQKNQINHKYLHFPRVEYPVYGELIARFLRGELGNINSVDPYIVALLYAGDRNNAKPLLQQWLDSGYFVLLDRYVNSNIAFQCAKKSEIEEQNKLKDWILKLEFEYNKLPVPDLNIFLDVPFQFTSKQLQNNRIGEDRNYLKGKSDIHEADLEFQKRVRDIYLSLEKEDNYKIIKCYDQNQEMLPPEKIFKKVVNFIFGE